MKTYIVSDIKWDFSDTDGVDPKNPPDLPTSTIIDIDGIPDDEVEEEISECLSRAYGFCHFGFTMTQSQG